MIHTYRPTRGSSWPENGVLRTLAKIVYYGFAVSLVTLFLIGLGWFFWPPQPGWVTAALALGVMTLIVSPLAAHWLSTQCKEIRLGDDGTCEFETRWRVVQSHVAQIASVKEEVDEDGDRYYYLRFRDRGNLWTCGLADFEDFLTRLEAMNPSIEIKRHKPWRLRRR